jgi:CheY-like chemotaxis protein
MRKLKVLIVDDKKINRIILGEMFRSWGIEYEEAEDALSAIEKLKKAENERPFNLILLDEWMPGINGIELAWEIRGMRTYHNVPIIIITSAENEETKRRAKALGISHYITRPIRQSELYNVIIDTIGLQEEETERREESKLKGLKLKVLLVEDNYINQQLITKLLEKQGWEVKLAQNGKEAVEMTQKEDFDIVLMDVQMPEMDGLTATKIIREREKLTGKHLPIIALTAHAFAEDREKCLKAGMDGYVSKPIKIKELWRTIEDVYEKVKKEKKEIKTSKISDFQIDIDRVLEMAGGDEEFVKELFRLFLNECPQRLEEIKKAIEEKNLSAIAKIAHVLKSSSGNLGINRIYNLCSEIEKLAKKGSLENLEDLYVSLREEYEKFREFVSEFEKRD